MTTETTAQSAARAWLHAYGIRTEMYTSGGDGHDHPAMHTLSAAFEAFSQDARRAAIVEVLEIIHDEGWIGRTEQRIAAMINATPALGEEDLAHDRPPHPLRRARRARSGWPIQTAMACRFKGPGSIFIMRIIPVGIGRNLARWSMQACRLADDEPQRGRN